MLAQQRLINQVSHCEANMASSEPSSSFLISQRHCHGPSSIAARRVLWLRNSSGRIQSWKRPGHSCSSLGFFVLQ